MAGGADKESKTEEATPKKISEAHKEGQFAKSQEVGTAFILFASFTIFAFFAKDISSQLGQLGQSLFGGLHEWEINDQTAADGMATFFRMTLFMLAPLMMATSLAAVLAGGLQSGFKPTPKLLVAKLEKLSPVKGFKKLFNLKTNGMNLGRDMLKFAAMGAILTSVLKAMMNDPLFAQPVPAYHIAEFIYELILDVLAQLLVVVAIIAIIDYIIQKKKTAEELKMTKQEVKDERKQQEGDPHVKSAQKRFAQRILQQSMLNEMPNADVVVTNPTHFAVALKYERGIDAAPVVIAKGKDAFAQRLKARARELGIPQVENRPVARLLHKVAQVGKPIPVTLYKVVAEILAQVYKEHRFYFHELKRRRREGTHTVLGQRQAAKRKARAQGALEAIA